MYSKASSLWVYDFICFIVKDLKGKRLLVLGGKAATVNVVQQAQKMGLETFVTGLQEEGQAMEIADHKLVVGSEEHEKLIRIIKDNHIDGVMTGSAEFQVQQMIYLCAKAGLHCYATASQWDATQDKRHFKDLCRHFNIPGVPEFSTSVDLNDDCFPVIVKPVDSCSSIGITICNNNQELRSAIEIAKKASSSGRILIEKYIENGGLTHNIKYVVVNGEYYMDMMCDRYVVKNGLITAVSFFPSENTARYLDTIDKKVGPMFRSIGFNNGVFFFSGIPDKDEIYIYEMGLRTGGGMNYKITEVTSGNNDLEMLIHFAITGEMCDVKDLQTIDPYLRGKKAASLAIPLRVGTIGEVYGVDEIYGIDGVVNYTHFCDVGDSILPKHLNTLSQLFGRIMIVRDTKEDLYRGLNQIRHTIAVKDVDGKDMVIWDTLDEILAK